VTASDTGRCSLPHVLVPPDSTYPRLAVQPFGHYPSAVEHVHTWARRKAHLSRSCTRTGVRIARPSAELAPGPFHVGRHIAQIAGCESGDEVTL